MFTNKLKANGEKKVHTKRKKRTRCTIFVEKKKQKT